MSSDGARIRAALLTREYPPEIYGGAGVHVEYLARALAAHVQVEVHCFGAPRTVPEVLATYRPWTELDGDAPHLAALRTLSVDLAMTARLSGVSIAHSHTWYANMAGHFAKLVYGVPHVMTSHSLEPLRPWKAEQLGGGYALSSFCERTAIEAADAVIAVSYGMRADIVRAYPAVDPAKIHVIYNGIDPDEFRAVGETSALARHGIDSALPYVIFVGRITRQKGIVHLLRAAELLRDGVQVVLCAGEPDTADLGAEVEALVSGLQARRGHVVWIPKMLRRPELVELLSHARMFVCPSVYEPFGIVNLEAMACATPVVASRVGGIPEIVEEGVTGYVVGFEPDGTARAEPADPAEFARNLAERMNQLIDDPDLARRMGEAGRARVLDKFSWAAIAQKTAELYGSLLAKRSAS